MVSSRVKKKEKVQIGDTKRIRCKKPTRLVIVNEHKLARKDLQDILIDKPDTEVACKEASRQEALALCSHPQFNPLLIEVRMPRIDGLTAIRKAK